MPSSALSLQYLIDVIVELQLGSVTRLRVLEDQAQELGDEPPRGWKTEQPVWQRQQERVEAVAHAVLGAELDTLFAAPDHNPLPRPDELLDALVGAERCRRLEGGPSADDVFSS